MRTTIETTTGHCLARIQRPARTLAIALIIIAMTALVMNTAFASEHDDSESAAAASFDAPLRVIDRADMISRLMNGEISTYSVGEDVGQTQVMDRADTIASLSDLDPAGPVSAGGELRSIDIADMINALEHKSGDEESDGSDTPVRLPRH